MNCLYLRDPLPDKRDYGHQIHGCAIHDNCITAACDQSDYPSCAACGDRLPLDSPAVSSDYKDPLRIITHDKTPTHALRGILQGGAAFLVCGGPSAKSLPLEQLRQRGCWSMAVNNMAAYIQPNAFICADPPSKFHEGIWRDPSVMKFTPTVKVRRGNRGKLRRKLTDGSFVPLEVDGNRLFTVDCPNVWGYGRRSWITPDYTFFTTEEAAWGNHDDGVKRTNEPKTVCTMMCGLRVLYYLGARRIYLVGVDFYMDPARDILGNYAFAEARDGGACSSNNSQFRVVNDWLCRMQTDGVFEKFGLEVYNCNPESGLRAFPHVPFADAVSDARRDWPDEPLDVQSFYAKTCPKCNKPPFKDGVCGYCGYSK